MFTVIINYFKIKTTIMKKIFLSNVIALTAFIATAQMDIPPDGGNIKACISEDVGITSISIKYCRPGMKGREGKIWGIVVPNGFGAFNFIRFNNSSPWRAGANEATVISFEHDIKLEGKDLKAGTYALFMAMGTDSVQLIFSRQADTWGSFYYREEDDVLRVKVKPVVLDKAVEWLKYEFIEHKEKSCVIAMQWEKLSVPFKVEVDVDNIVLARIKEQAQGVKGFISANWLQASRYFFMKGINMEEALGWAQRAVTGQPFGQSGFDAYKNLAMGYEKMNRMPQADSVMNAGLTIANINQYIAYGTALIAQKRKDNRAAEIMLAARVKFGDVYAVNNGLSYVYSAKGDYAKALEYANKALTQAPAPQLKTSINSNIEKLKAGKDINQ
jgi:hypothetical protein